MSTNKYQHFLIEVVKITMRISYLVFPATPISSLKNTNHCKEFKLPKEKLESDNPTIYLLHILPYV